MADRTETKRIKWSNISLSCLGRMLLRNIWMILAAAMIGMMLVNLFYDWLHVPKYQANMTYSVNSRSSSYITTGSLTSTREVASVLTELLKTDVMNESIRAHDPRLANFDGTITASQVGDSNFIIVTATASTPEQAFLALDALTVVFPTMADFISSRSVLNIMRNPSVSSRPSNMANVSKTEKVVAAVCALAVIALMCYVSIGSETIMTRNGARDQLDAPIIAAVCHERKHRTLKSALNTFFKRSKRHVQVFSPTTSFAYTEQIGAVCSQLEHEANARGRKVFLISGVGESEGKSTIAGNVAAALALKGHSVALVDCDLRKPAMARFFNGAYSSSMPLNKLLAHPYSLENIRKCMVRHEQLGLYMLFPINTDTRSAELISGDTMPVMIRQLRVFDFVIVDSPPMGMFPDAETLADMVDGSMLVVRQDYTAACDVNDAIDNLRKCKSAFIGCILNDMRNSLRGRYVYGNGNGYGQYGSYGKYGYGKYSYSGSKKYSYSGRNRKSHSSARKQ